MNIQSLKRKGVERRKIKRLQMSQKRNIKRKSNIKKRCAQLGWKLLFLIRDQPHILYIYLFSLISDKLLLYYSLYMFPEPIFQEYPNLLSSQHSPFLQPFVGFDPQDQMQVQISTKIIFRIDFKSLRYTETSYTIKGKIMYRNGVPLQIQSEYLLIFRKAIEKRGENAKIHFLKEDSSQFQFTKQSASFCLKQSLLQSTVESKIVKEIKNIRFALEAGLMTMGMIKKYNKRMVQQKSQELKLKKCVKKIILKQEQPRLVKKKQQKIGKKLLRQPLQICQVQQTETNPQQKLKKGGYFVVRKNTFEIKQFTHGKLTTSTEELAYKERRSKTKKAQLLNKKLSKEHEIVERVQTSNHFLTYWKCPNSSKFLMEYVPETLKSELRSKQVSVIEVIDIMKQIVQSVQELHEVNVVHRDIKSENFLLKKQNGKYNLKIIDFGESVFLDKPIQESVLPLGYTLPYSPFECIKSDETGTQKKQIDYWSVGVLIYEILNKKPPFSFGEYIGGNIVQDWLSNSSEFEMYINKRKKKGIRLIEEMATLMAINCLHIKQKSRLDLNQMMEILDRIEQFTDSMLGKGEQKEMLDENQAI